MVRPEISFNLFSVIDGIKAFLKGFQVIYIAF